MKRERANIMTQVAVIHTAFEDSPRTVALVEVGTLTGTDALDYAYRWTNNVEGSWSLKQKTIEFDGDAMLNGDYNEAVTVMAPLEARDGMVVGLRSTSMGDQMLLGTTKYTVAAMGFEPLN
jgi:hypothetical protein